MNIVIWSSITGLIIAILYLAFRKNLRSYRKRESLYSHWRERFPDCPENDLTDFLRIVNDAFLMPKSLRSKIHPDDSMMELYHACIGKWSVDSLEIEHLLLGLEDRFPWTMPEGLNLKDITFGELLAQVLADTA